MMIFFLKRFILYWGAEGFNIGIKDGGATNSDVCWMFYLEK